MKKLVLLVITSFVALGTSAIGIQTDADKMKRSVVSVVANDAQVESVERESSVVQWRR